MFRCACDPPTLPLDEGSRAVSCEGGPKSWLDWATTLPVRRDDVGVGRGPVHLVHVRRQLGERQRVRLLTAKLAERVSGAHVDRHA